MAKTPFGLLCFGRGPKPPAPAPAVAPGAVQPLQTTVANITRPLLPELHINIWERDAAFIDIGLMLDVKDQSTSIEILVPWTTVDENISDLSGRIKDLDAVYAIFNESWTVVTGKGGWIVEDPAGVADAFALVPATPGATIKQATYPTGDGDRYGVRVDVPQLIKQANQIAASTSRKTVEKLYVRFRLNNADRAAYCVGEKDKTGWWVPSWQRTDVIDFRVNVRRGAPTNIENDVNGWFMDFAKIQLFMMRDRNQDIVYEDKLFKACRSLEDEEFWARYSLNAGDNEDDVKSNVRRSMGYQWKDGGFGKRVREFGIAARFKIVEFGIGKYIIAALLLGALGNGLWDLGKLAHSKWKPDGPAEAICVKAGEGFVLPKQECAPNVKTDPAKGRTGAAAPKKE